MAASRVPLSVLRLAARPQRRIAAAPSTPGSVDVCRAKMSLVFSARRRYARSMRHPVTAALSHRLFDHTSVAHAYIGRTPPPPSFVGKPLAALHGYYPNAIVLGFMDRATGASVMNPPLDRVLQVGGVMCCAVLCCAVLASEKTTTPKP